MRCVVFLVTARAVNPFCLQIAHGVALCMFVASTALTGNAPVTAMINACAVAGIVGTLFAITAGLLAKSGARVCAICMLLVSYGCAVIGALGVIAACTQSWKATLLSAICTLVVLIMVTRVIATRRRGGTADAEAGHVFPREKPPKR